MQLLQALKCLFLIVVLFVSELLQIKVFGDGAHTVSSCQHQEYATVCSCLTNMWFAVSLDDTVDMRLCFIVSINAM